MRLWGTIEKVEDRDDGTIIVEGVASSEDVDCDGEVIRAEAMKAALPDYMRFANIREMHQAKAAGIALAADVDDAGKTNIRAHVVDSEAVKKVKTGVYKGFSIGGRVTGRDEKNKSIITGIKLSEISLVDRPANPSAVFEMWKAEGVAKGMYDVSRLAEILQSLVWLQECTEYEAEIEQDGSRVPAKLTDMVRTLSAILKEMVEEETSELTEGQKMSKENDLKKLADVTGERDAAIAKAASLEGELTKAKEETETVKADLAKAVADGETTKGELAKVSDALAALQKKFDELPAPAKGVTKSVTVSKEQDTGGEDELRKEAERIAAITDPEEKARELIKMGFARA